MSDVTNEWLLAVGFREAVSPGGSVYHQIILEEAGTDGDSHKCRVALRVHSPWEGWRPMDLWNDAARDGVAIRMSDAVTTRDTIRNVCAALGRPLNEDKTCP